MVYKATHKRVRSTHCPCCGEKYTKVQDNRPLCEECIENERDAG